VTQAPAASRVTSSGALARATTAVISVLLIAACSAGPEPRLETPAFYHPPPPPGASISDGSMCRCRACSLASCCGGAREPGAGDPPQRCEGYDFGAAGCELAVESCSARCYEETWRVRGAETCADKRPAVCCET
jgi:hypothetical protein